MNNKRTIRYSIITALVGLALAAGYAAPAAASGPATGAEMAATTAAAPQVAAVAGVLSIDEAEGLVFMREEEKLAHDVYLVLYDQWGLRTFANIASSEQTHTDAVASLLTQYGVADPAAELPAGQFANADLQALYDQLVDTGRQSLADALRVGAAIEEIDILDLEARMAETDRADILRVYTNLRNGSRNHLRAFASTLQRQTGSTYVPQYLDQAAYDAIVGTTQANRGRRGR